MLPNNEQEVVDIYTSYIEDVNQLAATQAVRDGTSVAIVTLFLGAQGYMASLLVTGTGATHLADSSLVYWLPVVAAAGIGLLGRTYCTYWNKQVENYRKTRNVKFGNLEKMEGRFPQGLQNAGAQLFCEEARVRAEDKKKQEQERKESRRGSRGASAQVIEIQRLFELVLVVVAIGALAVKSVAVLLPLLLPLLAQVRWPWM